MAVSLVPVGPGVPDAMKGILKSHEDAIRAGQNPGSPVKFPSIDTKGNLLAKAPAESWQSCAIICAEINAVVVSTLVGATWTWLRADGSAL